MNNLSINGGDYRVSRFIESNGDRVKEPVRITGTNSSDRFRVELHVNLTVCVGRETFNERGRKTRHFAIILPATDTRGIA